MKNFHNSVAIKKVFFTSQLNYESSATDEKALIKRIAFVVLPECVTRYDNNAIIDNSNVQYFNDLHAWIKKLPWSDRLCM